MNNSERGIYSYIKILTHILKTICGFVVTFDKINLKLKCPSEGVDQQIMNGSA